ncbi:MAG: hypothetical protein KDK60_00465, partial [Chlamydiia bacterium]|nr:hypothetical protein [Chlamydiia bacterium]
SRLHLKISVPENPLAFLRIGAKQNILLPLKIIGYGAIFAALKIDKATLTLWEAFLPVFGVIIGALLFWALFSTTLLRKGTMIAPKTLQTFHRSAALILILFSLIGLWELFLRR